MNVAARAVFVLALSGSFLVSSALGFSRPQFSGIGYPQVSSPFSLAADISANGQVVVGEMNNSSYREAFTWNQSDTQIVGLGELPGGVFISRATAVSGNGLVVVGESATPQSQTEAYRWEGGSMVALGGIGTGPYSSWADGISFDGSVVVGSIRADHFEAFRWTPEDGMSVLGGLPIGHTQSRAFSVSNDGNTVAGVSFNTDESSVFRWTKSGGMQSLGTLPGGARSDAKAISGDGTVIVGQSDSPLGFEAIRWTAESGMEGLGDLPGGTYRSRANDVSDDGRIVVGIANVYPQNLADPQNKAFIWREGIGMVDLNLFLSDDLGLDLAGWNLNEATGISADGGTIVGWGINPNGRHEAWIATIPEPTPVILIALGLFLMPRNSRSPATANRAISARRHP